MQGYRVKLVCVGEGKTEDEALDNLLLDLHFTRQHIEHDCSGADFLKFEECEIEDEDA